MSGRHPALAELTRQSATLLRVDAVPAGGGGGAGGQRHRAIMLTFDVGPLIVEPSHDRSELRVAELPQSDEPEYEATSLNEEEPWWALLGSPLTGAEEILEPDGRRAALDLQFRHVDENPRRVRLTLREDVVEIALERPAGTRH